MGATVEATTHPAAATKTDEHTLFDTNTAGGTGGTVGNSLAGLVGENDDDAWSQPKEPYVGMRFDTLEGAKEHYNAYALQLGFSIKMNTARRTGATRMLVKQQFVCNKFRKPTEDDGGVEKPPVLDKIVDQAEHVDEDHDIVFLDDERRMMHIMSDFYGTELIVPYGTKHITNLKTMLNKDATKEGDMIETVAYFKDQQKDDPDLFYKIKYDEEDRVENIFWVDGAARKAYVEAYHDCISFDTTYMTNMYNMPFALFIGINRHGQLFMLGCGFVRQEMASSFDWLFETFLEAMNGIAPTNIITDQDIAMAQSIKKMFPTSVHHCCRWHIMKKAQEKLGSMLVRNPGLSRDFNECVDFSLTPEEFETGWNALLLKYEVYPNQEWVVKYGSRSYYVTCEPSVEDN
ncbi:protein FAR1-RELATED SEQUENCE 5-like [Aegilops tauschii subsp. strangulata]|uniref:protein FAR1-RELATED SEQUENCE 5-like n=1 Tax=Aegilops tauschii subsp. strangulata TaxID=200361 RepID=UPI000989AAE3|nr:protein FAR1-RELATED SEQUENCE 5-like [Aegilops tauschii subsp. strangulata]